jgi:solute carrier family 25, member 34/35
MGDKCLVMQPADTALTRMYNQPVIRQPNGRLVGTLYKNPIDCLWKTFKTEGVKGWYKGAYTTRTQDNHPIWLTFTT